jgi:hypothetical protein
MAPVTLNNDVYLKVGGAASNAQFRNDVSGFGSPGFPNTDINSFNWLFGVGAQHYFNSAFSMNIQWLHLTGPSVTLPISSLPPASLPTSISVPPLDLFLVGIGINLNNLFYPSDMK